MSHGSKSARPRGIGRCDSQSQPLLTGFGRTSQGNSLPNDERDNRKTHVTPRHDFARLARIRETTGGAADPDPGSRLWVLLFASRTDVFLHCSNTLQYGFIDSPTPQELSDAIEATIGKGAFRLFTDNHRVLLIGGGA